MSVLTYMLVAQAAIHKVQGVGSRNVVSPGMDLSSRAKLCSSQSQRALLHQGATRCVSTPADLERHGLLRFFKMGHR